MNMIKNVIILLLTIMLILVSQFLYIDVPYVNGFIKILIFLLLFICIPFFTFKINNKFLIVFFAVFIFFSYKSFSFYNVYYDKNYEIIINVSTKNTQTFEEKIYNKGCDFYYCKKLFGVFYKKDKLYFINSLINNSSDEEFSYLKDNIDQFYLKDNLILSVNYFNQDMKIDFINDKKFLPLCKRSIWRW